MPTEIPNDPTSDSAKSDAPVKRKYTRRKQTEQDKAKLLPPKPPEPPKVHEIVLATRDEAYKVLEALMVRIDSFDVAYISDLYDLVNLESTYKDVGYGWTDANDISVTSVKDGYRLNLPTPKHIN